MAVLADEGGGRSQIYSDKKNDARSYIHLDVYPDSDMPLMMDFSTAASQNGVCLPSDVK